MRQLIDILDLAWRRQLTRFSGTLSSLLYLSVIYGNDLAAIAQPRHSQYGLGIEPREMGSLHSLPDYCVVAIAPNDGGRTISEYPTFYVYLLKRKDNFNNYIKIEGLIFQLYGSIDIPSRDLSIFSLKHLQLENNGFSNS